MQKLSKYFIVNKLFDFRTIFQNINRNIRCPFESSHEHKDRKPSAHIYKDENGHQSFYCFTCSKFYTAVDVIKKLNKDLDFIYNDIRKNYTEKELSDLKNIVPKKVEYVKRKNNDDIISFTKKFFENNK